MTALHESNLTSLPLLHRGKVRDIYGVDDQHLLIVQTDRLSAFDVILPSPVPGKGQVLTPLSNFWFAKLGHVIPNHQGIASIRKLVGSSRIIHNDGVGNIHRGICRKCQFTCFYIRIVIIQVLDVKGQTVAGY